MNPKIIDGLFCNPTSLRANTLCLLLGLALGCSGSGQNEPGLPGGNSNVGGSATGTGGASTTGGSGLNGTSGGVGAVSTTGGAQAAVGGMNAAGGANSGGSASGGTSQTGGAPTTGGASSAGGAVSTGGRSTGGALATGGAVTGGAKATGGTTATGGNQATGGAKATGGASSTGGATTTGGASATGGAKATGGIAATGGAKATGGAQGTGGTAQKFSVYIAGDSTVSTYTLDPNNAKSQAGWGQMLQQYYNSTYVTVVNKAVGGMTARHFIQAGNLDAILAALKAGDYFLVQFGTNDSNTTATYTINGVTYPYYADPNTDFKTYLQQYIDGAKGKGATPVLVTPPPRNSAYCGGGRSMAGYADAMIALGQADGVAVVNLSMKTWSYLNVICPKPADGTTENFFKVNADNTIDGTHFQINGATMMAKFVADGIGEASLGLNAYRIK